MYCAILAEYNPFHQGHLYQIQWIQKNLNPTGIIVFMAGNFMQRGEPALWDKWTRASHAINAGADVVIEFPTATSILAAEDYAHQAVSMMHRAGMTHQVFGVESATLKDLKHWVTAQREPTFAHNLQQLLAEGHSMAKARWLALVASGHESPEHESTYRMPNHILGRQYIQAHERYKTCITPIPLQRKRGLPSARELRQQVYQNGFPDTLSSDIKRTPPNQIFPTLFTHLAYRWWQGTSSTPPHSEPGLDERISQALSQSKSLDELLDLVTTKHHSRARMRRYLLQIILGYSAELYQLAKTTSWPLRLLQVKHGRGEAVLNYLAKQPSALLCKSYAECNKLSPRLINFEEKATDYHHYLLTGDIVFQVDRTHHFTLQN